MAAAATGMVLSVAQTLFAALQLPQVAEICSIFGYKSELEKLQGTVSTIKAVLLDLEIKQDSGELPHEARDWVEKLKDVVYDADDMFDEFNTILQQQQKLRDDGCKNNKILSKKVRRFFSRSNQLIFAFNMSLDIKKITKKLDSIASDHSKFGFKVDNEPIERRSRVETGSFVHEESIIGRDGDKEAIVDLLLGDSNDVQGVDASSFVTIVGIGGLGKTALAQLVYNDDRIKNAFELRLWVCVSEEFGMKEILTKMLKLDTNENCGDFVMDKLQSKVLQHIEGKKYLLVLDDVWEEDRNEWVDLKNFLNKGGRGSRVLVTSRSKMVATAIGKCYPMHELQGLSEEDSWCLFKRMAFDHGQEATDSGLVEIGKCIVKKCASVPLSIRVIGTLLYGQDRSWWMSFENNSKMPKVIAGKDETLEILRFSYHHLSPLLKSCFSYCALFPKDFEMQKNDLVSLWSAHGCIEQQYKEQSMEDAGEDCFSILLNRCFFQDIKKDDFGQIVSCKVHDLMHDLAQKVAGKEWFMWSSTSQLDTSKLRHLSVAGYLSKLFSSSNTDLIKMKNMRTIIQMNEYIGYKFIYQLSVPLILSNCRHLRVLDLSGSSIEKLPKTIDKLLHLRYLDLSDCNELKILPESITKLHNLETWKLARCLKLKALPKKLSELVNLRHLDLSGCYRLSHMPRGMSKMTGLHTLGRYVVGEATEKQAQSGELKDLKDLVNLKGNLFVDIKKLGAEKASKLVVSGGGYLLNKPRLKSVGIRLRYDGLGDVEEAALWEGLQPNRELREFEMRGNRGVKLPSWANTITTSFPCLVRIELSCLPRVQHLPPMSQIWNLRCLRLEKIPKVEYMETNDSCSDAAAAAATTTCGSMPPVDRELTFFPSLEKLTLEDLSGLKEWWRPRESRVQGRGDAEGASTSTVGAGKLEVDDDDDDDDDDDGIPESLVVSFSRLNVLTIIGCPNMTSFPPCPKVKTLTLRDINKSMLRVGEKRGGGRGGCAVKNEDESETSIDAGLATVTGGGQVVGELLELEKLTIDDVGCLNCLPKESVQNLTSLSIERSKVEILSKTFEEGFRNCAASSLKHLEIRECQNLKRLLGRGVVGGGIQQHLTALQSLQIIDCENLEMEKDEDEDEDEDEDVDEEQQSWKSLETTLNYLYLASLPKMVNLPKGIQYLTALQSLFIFNCDNLIGLPEWLPCLTSLQSLEIWDCPKVESLPEAMRHLNSLTQLRIDNCHPRLSQRCRRPDGEDFPNIQHIPTVFIDEF